MTNRQRTGAKFGGAISAFRHYEAEWLDRISDQGTDFAWRKMVFWQAAAIGWASVSEGPRQ